MGNATMENEVQKIKDIRALYPKTPRKTLAKQIADGKFPQDATGDKARQIRNEGGSFLRPMLSVYSVLRRAEAPKLAKAAKALANA